MTAKKKQEENSIDKFFELATFSSEPIVNAYYKSVKMMHYNARMTVAIEEFVKWYEKETDESLKVLYDNKG